jgi:hypothetical protein
LLETEREIETEIEIETGAIKVSPDAQEQDE